MRICVVGGGTAGWITALYAKKIFPHSKITVIESSEIGILGAGEGTTPHFISLLNFLDISFSDLIKKTDCTIKNAIKFSNWSNLNFYHSFYDPLKIDIYNYQNFISDFKFPPIDYTYAYANNKNLNDYFISTYLCEKNMVPFSMEASSELTYGIHFNARKIAEYLKNIALSRGIKLIDNEVINFYQDLDGNISKIILKNNIEEPCDFVFDCTGFNRLIIGKLFKSKWKSHSEYLPAKRAIPFFIEIKNNIEPYTSSTAMNYGWMWKIPTQNRYGCGYVFDSDFISDEDAKKEVEDYLGFNIDVPKIFSFNAGSYEKVWIKNCLAVGLSSGFIEPLEATSLWQMIRLLSDFLSNDNNIYEKNENVKNFLNKRYSADTEEVVSFLYLHYKTNKNQNDFWKNFDQNNKTPSRIEELLDIIKYEIPSIKNFEHGRMFPYSSYMSIIFGNNLINDNIVKKYKIDKEKMFELEKRKNDIKNFCKPFLNHNDYLTIMRNNE